MTDGHFASQYESVMTKPFFHGRTEAGRSCTSEAAAFAEAWVNMAVSLPGRVAAGVGGSMVSDSPRDGANAEADAAMHSGSSAHLRDLFEAAWKAQVGVVRNCAKGHGVDRHMYGLRCIANKSNVAVASGIFDCPAYTKLTGTILSTSNCGNPSLRLFGFGPVSAGGYGIGYIIKDDGIQFCISSKHRQTARYVLTLQKFLRGMWQLLHEDARQKVRTMTGVSDASSASATAGNDDGQGEYDYFGLGDSAAIQQYKDRQLKLKSVGSTLKTPSSASSGALASGAAAKQDDLRRQSDGQSPQQSKRRRKTEAAWSADAVKVVPPSPNLRPSDLQEAELFGY